MMFTRRQFLARTGALAGLAAGGAPLWAATKGSLPDGKASRGMITKEADEAIKHGLKYLAEGQHADGSFGSGFQHGNIAITSLAALALMSGGHQPGRGKYGKHVNAALDFILKQESTTTPGYLFNREGIANGLHGPMYAHGFATLFLGEVYGMAHKKELRKKLRGTLRRAVDLIVKSQNKQGGWRYQPYSTDADISVTICQIMALRSARNAGIAVPKSTVLNCIKYVKECQNNDGGFRYTQQIGPSGFARTAAGVAALYSAGVYKGPEVEGGLRYLMGFKPGVNVNDWNRGREYAAYYFYGHYYAVQAMWTAGGKYWKEWYPAIRDDLLARRRQFREGIWYDRICAHYGTAMACIILQIPNNYLPILQK
jgi:hypothetical protein